MQQYSQRPSCPIPLTALPCPENSQYQLCGSVCPATCNDQAAPNNCSSPCMETCQCNEGFVLDAGKCIHKACCGCEFQGHLYAPGEQFWGDSTCTRRCVCDPQSRQVSCQATGCRTGEQCRVENGIQNCYPSSYRTCSASGDPHYTSFHIAVSFTRAVEVRVYGVNIMVSRDYPGRFLDAVIQTNFHLIITFDWQGQVTLTAPSTYTSAMCSLCGNFNGDKGDELIMKDGRAAPNATAFGQSWQVAEMFDCTEADNALSCPARSHYKLCMHTCDMKCITIAGLARCFEGCQCERGLASDGEACVSLDACGCTTYEGQYLQVDGTSLASVPFSTTLSFSPAGGIAPVCLPSGSLTCTPHWCPSRRPCGLRNSMRGCYAKRHPCLVAPGQLLSTFDGFSGAAPISGAHDVSRVCEQNTTSWFRFVLESWQWQPDARHVAMVYMILSAVFIATDTEGTAWVNGQEVLLPTSINAELSLTRSQQGMVVQWMEKVEAHLNATGVLEVTANGSYAAQLCGACGNFNGDSMDDLMACGGRPASNTQEVLASWVAEDFSSSW
ncbi:IgGFc-binding protein [Chelonia mydas]|uniref:IgGFc-binding protein n=1 Tax=Chelonia mydas TaxID=8469 RepID=M7BCL1_CHEMY|nr:IgGFc-binding protein [Chelonia mydas]